MKILILISFFITTVTARAELYDSASHPSNFNRIAGISIITNFYSLPQSGRLSDDRLGWSESYRPRTWEELPTDGITLNRHHLNTSFFRKMSS